MVLNLDTAAIPTTTARFAVTGIATMYLYVGGEVVKSFTGAKPKSTLLKALEEYL